MSDARSEACEFCEGTGRFKIAPTDDCAMCLGTGLERVATIRRALRLIVSAAGSDRGGFRSAAEQQVREATLLLASDVTALPSDGDES